MKRRGAAEVALRSNSRTCARSAVALLAALLLAGCGTTEKTGVVGETLDAKGLQVTVFEVDTEVPVPEEDITGLSQPSPGTKLVGSRVQACSDHGGALVAADFGLETTDGEAAALKYPQRNYGQSFESLRDGCAEGWIVFQIPEAAEPGTITFGFQDTGSFRRMQNNVDARFTWTIE